MAELGPFRGVWRRISREAKPSPSTPRNPAARTSLLELAVLFLRLGATLFGGPAVHVAVFEDEFVRRRKWLSPDQFLDLLGVVNLIPGPNSTEMVIHVGRLRAGWPGFAIAGLCFILPAALLTGVCAWAYVRFGALPQAGWLLYGVKPVVLAVVVQAIVRLSPHAARTWPLRTTAALCAVLVLAGAHELAVLFGAGVVWLAWAFLRYRPKTPGLPLVGVVPLGLLQVGATAATMGLSLWGIFGVFLKAGALLFGSGYVLLAYLRADLVEQLGWLTEAQLIEAVAVGQVTPGPLFSAATFIGYVLAGPVGAMAATIGIFLPAFAFVAAGGPLFDRLRSSPRARAFLDGVTVASLALMAVVALQLGRAALVDVPCLALGVASAVLLVRFRLNSTWLILGGAASGWILHLCRVA